MIFSSFFLLEFLKIKKKLCLFSKIQSFDYEINYRLEVILVEDFG